MKAHHEIPDLKGKVSIPVGKSELWETRNKVLRKVTEDDNVVIITEKGQPICAIVPVNTYYSTDTTPSLEEKKVEHDTVSRPYEVDVLQGLIDMSPAELYMLTGDFVDCIEAPHRDGTALFTVRLRGVVADMKHARDLPMGMASKVMQMTWLGGRMLRMFVQAEVKE